MSAPSLFILTSNGGTQSGTSKFYVAPGFGRAIVMGNTTEAQVQNIVGTAGAFKNLYCTSFSNARNANIPVTLRVGPGGASYADSALTVTITASTTGTYTDTTHTVTVAQGDGITLVADLTSGTGGLGLHCSAMTFTPNSGTTASFASCDTSGVTLSGTGPITDFVGFAGNMVSTTVTEANSQMLVQVGGTAKYMGMYVATNSRGTSSTVVTFRKNGGAGNQTFTYAASTTGLKTDTANSDTLSTNDLICCSPALGTGTGNFVITAATLWIDSGTDGSFWAGNTSATGIASGTGTTFCPIAGTLALGSTEGANSGQMGTAGTASGLWCYVSVNASTTNPSLQFRKNTASGNQAVTITALTTGAYQDATHSDTFATTDLIAFRLNGITTAAITVNGISMLIATAINPTATGGGSTLLLMGVG